MSADDMETLNDNNPNKSGDLGLVAEKNNEYRTRSGRISRKPIVLATK